MTIAVRLEAIRAQMKQSAFDSGRNPNKIILLAVSKRQAVEKIEEAIAAGQQHFGENQCQEALDKMAELDKRGLGQGLTWHFIGTIQSNKTRDIAENFDWVHGLCSLKHARRLSEQRPARLGPLNICLQINIDHELTKSGIYLEECDEMAEAINDLPNLSLRGLMCIPKADSGIVPFKRMREIFLRLNKKGFQLDTLSMGMSGDFCEAISAGSTIIRVGTGIFGKRDA